MTTEIEPNSIVENTNISMMWIRFLVFYTYLFLHNYYFITKLTPLQMKFEPFYRLSLGSIMRCGVTSLKISSTH